MSNFPENEDQVVLGETAAEEFSTVFSDPAQHKKGEIKKNPRLKKAIAALLAVAVLVSAAFAVVKLIPEPEEDETNYTPLESYTVLAVDTTEIDTVEIINPNGDFKFYSETTEEDGEEVTTWYADGYEGDITDSTSIESIVAMAGAVTAVREIDKTPEACGLNTPEVTVHIVTTDGEEYKFFVGDDSADGVGSYVKFESSDVIYLSDTSLKLYLGFEYIDILAYADTPFFTADDGDFDDYLDEYGDLAKFDTITISGVNFDGKVVVKPNDDELLASVISTIIIEPVVRTSDALDQLVNIFLGEGLAVCGAYSADVSAASLKAVGLDNPDFVATMSINGVTMTYKFKSQGDGYCAVVCDKDEQKMIKMVSDESLDFLNYDLTDLYSDYLCLIALANLKNLTVTTPDNEYSFDIETVVESSVTNYYVKYNGELVDTSDFQNIYQQIAALACSDYDEQKTNEKPAYTFTFTYTDDIGGSVSYEFTKVSETRYQCSQNGKALGKLTSTSLNKFIRNLEAYVESLETE